MMAGILPPLHSGLKRYIWNVAGPYVLAQTMHAGGV
jgi:hypothetical protein